MDTRQAVLGADAERASPAPAPPPGPRSMPLHLIAFFRNPLACYRKLVARYGDPFTVPFLLGNRMVVTGAPNRIKELFTTSADAYETVDRTGEMFFGPNAVVLLDGEPHRRMRELLGAPLLAQRGRGNGPMIVDVAQRHVGAWPLRQRFVLIEKMRRISLEVILRAVYGMDDPARIEAFSQAFHALHGRIGFWVVFVPALRCDLGRWSPWRRFLRARDALDALVYAEIRAARARGFVEGRVDVLNHLVGAREGGPALSDEAIRDNLLTMLAAGHESTATALAWSVMWTYSRPEVLSRLRAELADFAKDLDADRLKRLPFLEAVCRETLRIHPVATNVARKLKRETVLFGRRLPAGTVVSASIDLAHHDPAVYADPDRFRPERFLERRHGAGEFLPFGGGRRHCIGADLGFEEMRLVLAVIVTRLDLALLGPTPPRPTWREGTMGPKGGVPLEITARRPG